MKLHFFGTGSGFAESHTNAYFFYGKDLVLIDMSMDHVRKAVSLAEEKNPENIFLLLTHLHPDHVSGVSILCQFLYYTRNKTRLKIMIPDALVNGIMGILDAECADSNLYEIISGKRKMQEQGAWLHEIIPAFHTPELEGKCFGYLLKIDGKDIVYTGDTCHLDDFMPYFHEGCEAYIDCSVHYGGVHLKLEDEKDRLTRIAENGIDVYLMHTDDLDALEKQKPENVHIAYPDTQWEKPNI